MWWINTLTLELVLYLILIAFLTTSIEGKLIALKNDACVYGTWHCCDVYNTLNQRPESNGRVCMKHSLKIKRAINELSSLLSVIAITDIWYIWFSEDMAKIGDMVGVLLYCFLVHHTLYNETFALANIQLISFIFYCIYHYYN